MKTLFVIAAALVAAYPTGQAFAGQPEPARAVISTAGLDLSTEAGVRALDLRILHAASEVCGTPSSADAQGREKRDQCRAEVQASAAPHRARAIALARQQGEALASR